MGKPVGKAAKLRAVVAAVQAVAPPTDAAKAAKQYGNTVCDASGAEHDLAELRDRRNAAVSRGMKHMYKFFRRNNYSALHEVGDDAPSIFFECWCASRIARIASRVCRLVPVQAAAGFTWPPFFCMAA